MMKGTKPTVLVVEDDEPIRNLIVTTLEMEKYKFDTRLCRRTEAN